MLASRAITGLGGRFTHARTPDTIRCAFMFAGGSHAQSDPHDNPPRDLVGKVAVTTHFMTVRFDCLWVVIPRP